MTHNRSIALISVDAFPLSPLRSVRLASLSEVDRGVKRIVAATTAGARPGRRIEHVITSYSIHYTKLYDYDAYGSYNIAFVSVSILLFAGAVGLVFAKPPQLEQM